MAALLSAGITPVVHEYGSLGCSGDLAPLSHCALALMGEGEVRRRRRRRSTDAADGARRGRARRRSSCEAKEGLALINGTDGMLGMLVLAIADLRDAAHGRRRRRGDERRGASSAPTGCSPPTCRRCGRTRARPRRRRTCARLLADSGDRRQPPRPGLQPGAGRLLAALLAAGARRRARHRRPRRRRSPARELASAIDNPVVLADGRVESNGNFHGAPVGYVLDFLAIAAADVASISERRTDRFLDPARSHGLPPFLADDPGVDSGHMIAQYTQAAIVSELKRLAVPASVDSIPSSAMQEDHVSMGWSAARKLRRSRRRPDPGARDRAPHRRARARPARAARAGAGHRRRRRAAARSDVAGPGPDRHLAPEIEHAVDARPPRRRPVAAVEDMIGRTRMTDCDPARSAPPRGTDADRAARGRPRRRCGC